MRPAMPAPSWSFRGARPLGCRLSGRPSPFRQCAAHVKRSASKVKRWIASGMALASLAPGAMDWIPSFGAPAVFFFCVGALRCGGWGADRVGLGQGPARHSPRPRGAPWALHTTHTHPISTSPPCRLASVSLRVPRDPGVGHTGRGRCSVACPGRIQIFFLRWCRKERMRNK